MPTSQRKERERKKEEKNSRFEYFLCCGRRPIRGRVTSAALGCFGPVDPSRAAVIDYQSTRNRIYQG